MPWVPTRHEARGARIVASVMTYKTIDATFEQYADNCHPDLFVKALNEECEGQRLYLRGPENEKLLLDRPIETQDTPAPKLRRARVWLPGGCALSYLLDNTGDSYVVHAPPEPEFKVPPVVAEAFRRLERANFWDMSGTNALNMLKGVESEAFEVSTTDMMTVLPYIDAKVAWDRAREENIEEAVTMARQIGTAGHAKALRALISNSVPLVIV